MNAFIQDSQDVEADWDKFIEAYDVDGDELLLSLKG